MYNLDNLKREKRALQKELEKMISRNRFYGNRAVDPKEIDLKSRIDLLDLQLQKNYQV